jgi:hypothetical protein
MMISRAASPDLRRDALKTSPPAMPRSRPFGRKLSTTAIAKEESEPKESTAASQRGRPVLLGRERRRRYMAANISKAVPITISRTAIAVSRPLRSGWESAVVASALSMITAATPITVPIRKGSAARLRLGESKIKIVTVRGTELNARATAIGSSAPSACHIAPDRPLWC